MAKMYSGKTNPQTVLITGGSNGIGFELAKLFAKDKYSIILVARNEQRLHEAASILRDYGADNVTVISKDLSIEGSPCEIYDEVKRKGLTVNILVNDAGIGVYGLFSETSVEEELGIIRLNISALVHMTKLFLKDMLTMNGGKILQLASIASYQPTPMLAVYAATKAFVLSFTDSLINELENSNVTITALIPDATATDFFRKAGMQHTKAAQNAKNPKVVAKEGYEALMTGDRHALAPGVRSQIVMSSIMPNENIASMARKQMEPVK